MSNPRGASSDVIALLLEKRESHLAKAIEYEQAIIDLGCEVPEPEEEVVERPKRKYTKRATKRAKYVHKNFKREQRKDKVIEYAGGLNGTGVSVTELAKLIYPGTSKRIRGCWVSAVSLMKNRGVLTTDENGLIVGVAS